MKELPASKARISGVDRFAVSLTHLLQMRGRYTSTSTTGQLAAIFDEKDVRTEALPARYNVAPAGSVR